MKMDRKITIFIVGFILTGMLVSIFFPKEEKRNDDALIRVGAGADVSGILMEETVSELSDTYTVKESLESSSFQDC
ncbi:MAG: hypothetical protein PUG71_01430 [bacterium]|nr:hypothetical protein [bacterium]